jgi:hypothetical protein
MRSTRREYLLHTAGAWSSPVDWNRPVRPMWCDLVATTC